jgi:putative membrane protein (TIGR04086 family)
MLFGHRVDIPSVLMGAALAALVSVPVAAILDGLVDDPDSAWNVVAVAVVGLGYVAGGFLAGYRQPRIPAVHGALAAGVAVLLLVAVRVITRLAEDEAIGWATVGLSVLLATWLGMGGGVLGSRRAVAQRDRELGRPIHRDVP